MSLYWCSRDAHRGRVCQWRLCCRPIAYSELFKTTVKPAAGLCAWFRLQHTTMTSNNNNKKQNTQGFPPKKWTPAKLRRTRQRGINWFGWSSSARVPVPPLACSVAVAVPRAVPPSRQGHVSTRVHKHGHTPHRQVTPQRKAAAATHRGPNSLASLAVSGKPRRAPPCGPTSMRDSKPLWRCCLQRTPAPPRPLRRTAPPSCIATTTSHTWPTLPPSPLARNQVPPSPSLVAPPPN